MGLSLVLSHGLAVHRPEASLRRADTIPRIVCIQVYIIRQAQSHGKAEVSSRVPGTAGGPWCSDVFTASSPGLGTNSSPSAADTVDCDPFGFRPSGSGTGGRLHAINSDWLCSPGRSGGELCS